MEITYNKYIKEKEKEVAKANMEVAAVKWLLLNSKFYPGFMHLNDNMPEECINKLNKYIDMYVKENIPCQYILNKAFFYGYEFYVDERCFIPRDETEELVENTINYIDDIFDNQNIEIADVCTGSGIIGITLKKEINNSNVLMCDISKEALEVASINAKKLEADVTIIQGDFIDPIKGKKFDVIVCNPPYIKDSEILEKLVVEHEPNIALFGGVDGLFFYKKILLEFDNLINKKGFMSFEIGYDLKEGLESFIKDKLPDKSYVFKKDYAGNDRMLFVFNK